jgi:capsular exopolysaccharide synthesis family protein
MNLPAPIAPNNLPAAPPVFQPISLGVTEEQKLELLEYWRSITKRKWPILGLALVAALVAGAVAFALTPIYRSTATVLIEAGKAKILSIEDIYTASTQGREQYQTQVELLQSRAVAIRTIKALKLWDMPEFDPRKPDTSLLAQAKAALGMAAKKKTTWTEDELADAIYGRFKADLTVEPVRLSQLVKVSFDSDDKRLAANVANAVADNYIDNDRDSRFDISQQVSSYLEDRLGALRDKLAKSENALQAYREAKGIVNLSGSAQTLAGQAAGDTTSQLVQARAKRLELQSMYDQVRGITNGDFSNVPWVMRDPGVTDTQKQVSDAQSKLADLQQTLGANNSNVQRAQAQLASLNATLKRQRADAVEGLKREYNAAVNTEQGLSVALASVRTNVKDVNRDEFQLAALDREVQTNRELYDMFMNRAKETNLASDVQAPVARIVDPAAVARLPVKPAKVQIVAVAAVLALFIGAMVSLLLDKLDNTVKGGEDAESRLRLPLLTSLPALTEHNHDQMARIFIDEPNSHHAEGIRTARTGVLLSNIDKDHKVLLVTSTVPGEGKTTVAINLALAHAQTKRTLLVDADMRRPQVGRRLGIPPGTKGLSNLVAGTAPLEACLQTVGDSQLVVMPVGDLPPNPLELLLSKRFSEALQGLSDQFDIIIIDSPPVELVSEALVIAPQATSTILVVKAMSTPAPLVRKSIQRLQRAGANMLGVVVNHLDFSKAQRYHGQYGAGSYNYGYGYGDDGVGYGYGYNPKLKGKASKGAGVEPSEATV